jgi:hypothetical protein
MQNIKNEIFGEITALENNTNELQKRKGRTIRLFANNVSCFKCIDTKKSWTTRTNLPWSALDGRGSYDIVGCSNCSKQKWINCSHTNDCRDNDLKIFNVKNDNWKERLEEIYNKASKDVYIVESVNKWINDLNNNTSITNKPEPTLQNNNEETCVDTKPLFEVCKRITKDYLEKSLDVNIEVGKIIDIVKNTVEAYFGNTFSLVDLAKELKVSFSISDSQSETNDKLIKIKDNNYLGIKTCTKITNNIIKTGLFEKNKFAKEYTADIFILKPLNENAVEKATMIMGKIGEEMTDDILKDF